MEHSVPHRLDGIIGAIDKLTSLSGHASGISLLGIFVLILFEILARNFVGSSLAFSWDYASYLMGACFMLGCASALREGSHVRVTALAEVLSPANARRLEIAATLCGLLICVFLAYALVDMSWLSFTRGSASSSVVRTPLWIPQSFLALGAVILVLQMIAQLLRVLRGERLSSGPGLE